MPSTSDGAADGSASSDSNSDLLSSLRQRLEARRAVLGQAGASSRAQQGQQLNEQQQILEGEEEDEEIGEPKC